MATAATTTIMAAIHVFFFFKPHGAFYFACLEGRRFTGNVLGLAKTVVFTAAAMTVMLLLLSFADAATTVTASAMTGFCGRASGFLRACARLFADARQDRAGVRPAFFTTMKSRG